MNEGWCCRKAREELQEAGGCGRKQRAKRQPGVKRFINGRTARYANFSVPGCDPTGIAQALLSPSDRAKQPRDSEGWQRAREDIVAQILESAEVQPNVVDANNWRSSQITVIKQHVVDPQQLPTRKRQRPSSAHRTNSWLSSVPAVDSVWQPLTALQPLTTYSIARDGLQ